jgi:hypothetical protein
MRLHITDCLKDALDDEAIKQGITKAQLANKLLADHFNINLPERHNVDKGTTNDSISKHR